MLWWLKILLKIFLSRLPIKYLSWSKLSIFRHGTMDKPEYAFKVAEKHFNRASSTLKNQFTSMEIGPGDSLLSSICMSAFGSSKTYMVDIDDFAIQDENLYYEMFKYIDESTSISINNNPIFKKLSKGSPEEIINTINAKYLTRGIKSLEKIPDNSIDFIWSQAVLEHIKLNEFDQFMTELCRILKIDGVSSHRIDLKDHLSGGLKNLFFSEKIWESNFMSSSGFYTNRIRYNEMISRFINIGFDVQVINADRWEILPDKKKFMSKKYSILPDSELCISGFDIILNKNK